MCSWLREGLVFFTKACVEGMEMPRSLACLCGRYSRQERLRADRAGRLRAPVDHSRSALEVETETSGYLHSQVTCMRNGLGGHVTGVKANTKESIYYPGRKFVLLDSVAADIMISFPSVEGD